MVVVNKILLLNFAIVLGCHTLLSRGLDYDGAYALISVVAEGTFSHWDPARIVFSTLSELPAWLFIKLSSSFSLSLLTILYSFGLIWVHIISIVGCFLILPKDKKQLLFFPLFGFLTGPLPALGMSVSMALSVCSYVWLVAFIIYYSNLSIWNHRLFVALAPLPLILSHELMSYMAFPLIALCIVKYKKEPGFLNRKLIESVTLALVISSALAFWFPFIAEVNIDNRAGFLHSLINFRFIYSPLQGFNLPVIISICLILFLNLCAITLKKENQVIFKGKAKGDSKNFLTMFLSQFFTRAWFKLRNTVPLFLFILISVLSSFLIFNSNTFGVSGPNTRVWPPCFALPLGLTLWWFLKDKEIQFRIHRWFLLSLVLASVVLTLWRVQSDWEFYKHQKEFSKVLSTFQGIVEWSDVESAFQNIPLKRKIGWTMTAASLLYPRSQTVRSVLIEPYFLCKRQCARWSPGSISCDDICRMRSFKLRERDFTYFSESRFFNFSLIESETN